MKPRSSTDVCVRCGKTRRQAGALIPHKSGFICDLCIIQKNKEILQELEEVGEKERARPDSEAEEETGDNKEAGDEEGEEENSHQWPMNQVDFERVDQLLKQHGDFPRIEDLSVEKIDPDAVTLIPRAMAEQYCLIPIRKEGRQLTVAFSDPNDEEAIQDIKGITDCDISVVAADAYDIEEAIEKYYNE